MKERPILFSGEMVRAILSGRKKQTRRVVKLAEFQPSGTSGYRWSWRDKRHRWNECNDAMLAYQCPYGIAGDRLWVREAFADVPCPADEPHPRLRIGPNGEGITWRADWTGNPSGFKWQPSIHMPRWASRITLEITGIRVERLQDITEEDAIAEGLEKRSWVGPAQFTDNKGRTVHGRPLGVFRELWQSINGPESWAANPWVWVVSFRRIES